MLAAVGGVLLGAGASSATDYTGCLDVATGHRDRGAGTIDSVRIGVDPLRPCGRGEVEISWSSSGPAGPQGPVGTRGPAGPQGATGPQGPIGPRGPAGIKGATGAQGAPGNVGAAGPEGSAGADGPVGQPGDQGPAGPQGAGGPFPAFVSKQNGLTFVPGEGAFGATLALPDGFYRLQATVTFTNNLFEPINAGCRVARLRELGPDVYGFYTPLIPQGASTTSSLSINAFGGYTYRVECRGDLAVGTSVLSAFAVDQSTP
jgi:Collagen triple helix repeat (20 copies)